MNKHKILIKIVGIIFVVFVLCPMMCKSDNISYNYNDMLDTVYTNVILNLSNDAGQEYVDKLYFVGDSTTYHFFKGGIDRSHILVPDSYTLKLTSDINNILVGDKKMTISKTLHEENCEIVIITLGANGADSFSETKYKTYYKKLIADIKKESPNTKIIIQSVFPVADFYSDLNIGITNEGINRINKWALEIANEENVKYLDTQSILKDDTGAQIQSYGENDGIHMNSKAYEKIIYYIRTHALESEYSDD